MAASENSITENAHSFIKLERAEFKNVFKHAFKLLKIITQPHKKGIATIEHKF